MGNHESLVKEMRAEFIALATTLQGRDSFQKCLWEEDPEVDFSQYMVFLYQPEIDDLIATYELWWDCRHACPDDPVPADEFLARVSTLSPDEVQAFVDSYPSTLQWCRENFMMKGNKLMPAGQAVADFVKQSWLGEELLKEKCQNQEEKTN